MLREKNIGLDLANTKAALVLSSKKRKNPMPLKPGEILPGAPKRAKFHPARRIQGTKLPRESKPKSHSSICRIGFSVWGPHTT